MNVKIHKAPDARATADACARYVLQVLQQALASAETATLAISGGSTPKLMFARLAASPFQWSRVHLFWVDERCVPPADDASNYKLANDYLIQPAGIPASNVHRIIGEIPPQEAAARYGEEIRRFFGLKEGDLPRFDVVQQGMGPDGHTASLFPGDPLIDDHTGIAAATFAPQFNQWRVTLLPGPLLAAKHTVFLVSGDDKAETLRVVVQGEYDPKRHPSQIGLREGVDWFVDEPAARLLETTTRAQS
jgi:6-phosphogluconolactonase